MSDRPFALTAYPLSGGYRERLERLVGAEPVYLNLSELRRQPPAVVLRTLASLRGRRALLPAESEDAAALRPVLELVAAATLPRRIELLGPALDVRPVSRTRAAASAAALVRASLDGRLAVRAARRELRRLAAAEPLRPRPGDARSVLFLNGNLWIGVKAGGSIAHVAGVVNGFHDEGLAVELATVVEPIGVRADVAVRPLAPPAVFGLPVETNYWRFQRSMAGEVRGLVAGARRHGFVYQRLSVANYVGVLAARALGVPLVLEYNGSEVWIAEHWGTPLRYAEAARAAEAVSLRHADVVVTVSEALRDELVARGVEPDRVVFHPNGVDPGAFDPDRFSAADRAALRRRYGLEPDDVVAGFIGTFGQWHGVEVLAQAIRLLADRRPDAVRERRLRFLLVGDGLKMPLVRRLLAEPPYRDVAVLAGLVPQAEAPAHLAACDLLVSPHVPNADGTPFFGSPTKLFEYMATGRAIVASRLDQIGEVLAPEDGVEPALLTEPGSADALADAILLLAGEPARRAALGRAARARVLDRYTWRHHVAAILERVAAL